MPTFSLKAKIADLGYEMEKITDDIAKDLVAAVHNIAAGTYNKAVELAGQRLHSTRQQYINALHLSQESEGVWIVYLDPEANHLEDGQEPHAMLPKLAMGPKSKIAKDGSRYVTIPMRQHMAPLNPSNPQHADLASRLKELSKIRKWDKVKEGTSQTTGKHTTVERMQSNKDDHPYLKGLTRIREYQQPGAKQPISSAYFTYRTASTKQDPSQHWFHTGTAGAQVFPELEQWVDFQLEVVLGDILGDRLG